MVMESHFRGPNDLQPVIEGGLEQLAQQNAAQRIWNGDAITDPGTPLEQLASAHHFRHIFSNPADIGGRYSALSYFGLVPGALIGVDIEKLLSRAQEMMQQCGANQPAQDNPGLWLGAALGTLATQQRRNKITFTLSPGIASFGLWVEQLIAESTGKEGRGLVPIASEQLGKPQDYGNDRVFVYLRLYGSQNSQINDTIETLVATGQPEIHYDLRDDYDLGAQFFLWEFAVATVGHFLNINPFNEPNVQESKDNTNNILARYEKQGQLPEPQPVMQQENITIYGPSNGAQTLNDYLHNFLSQVRPGDYIALMAYVQQTEKSEGELEALRIRLRDLYKVATTVGYGPRFLHSTGQLHKGGANNGVFIQITGQDQHDMPIPGAPYTFGILKAAQALGDFYSLEHHQRRVISIHISGDLGQGLHVIEQAV